MKHIKGFLITAVILLLSLSLMSCSSKPSVEPEPVIELIENYKGPSAEYNYLYTEPRDLAWEEDIVRLANDYCNYHAYLNVNPSFFSTKDVYGNDLNIFDLGLYSEDKYNAFLEEINQIINAIPTKSDNELNMLMAKAVASLHDVHSNVYFNDHESYLPYFFEAFREDGAWVYRMLRCPEENSDLLYSKLISVNGYSQSEIISLAKDYFCYENEDYAIDEIGLMLNKYEYMEAIGLLQDNKASLKLEKYDGEVIDIEFFAFPDEQYQNIKLIRKSRYDGWGVAFDSSQSIYHLTFNDNTLYFSVRSLLDPLMVRDYLFEAISKNKLDYLIIDFRNCPGGSFSARECAEIINWGKFKKVYVLINQGTASDGVLTTHLIRSNCDNVTVIGTDAAQPINSFAIGGFYTDHVSANNNITYIISTGYVVCDLAQSEPLKPDVYLYQTIDDYKNDVDTILEYALKTIQE